MVATEKDAHSLPDEVAGALEHHMTQHAFLADDGSAGGRGGWPELVWGGREVQGR